MLKPQLVFCLLLHTLLGLAQPENNSNNYDLKKTRLLLQTVGTYVFANNMGTIDLDSAMVIAARAEHIRYALWYDEGYDEGRVLPGQLLLDAGDIPAAVALLPSLHGENRILLLLQLGAGYLHRVGDDAGDMDRAFAYLQQAEKETMVIKNDKLQNAALNLLGNYAARMNNPALGHRYFSEAAQVCRKLNDNLLLANTFSNEATALSNYDTSKPVLLKNALLIYQRSNEKEKQVKTLGELAAVCLANGKMDSVALLTTQAITLENAIGFRHTHYSYNALAYVELMKTDWLAAVKMSHISVSVMEANQDTALACFFYTIQAQAYLSAQKGDEALNIFYKVLNSYKEGPILWYHLFLNSVSTLASQKKYTEALQLLQQVTKKYPPQKDVDKMAVAQYTAIVYQKLKQYKESEKYMTEMIRLADKIQSPAMDKDRANAYSAAALFYTEVQQFGKARYYLNKATAFPVGKMAPYAKINITWIKYKIDSANGMYLLALKEFQQYSNYEDSLYNLNILKQSSELVVKYETEKKEKDIRLLNGETKLQQAELAKTTLIKNSTLAGIAVMLVIAALIYNQYRINKKSAKKISKKNESLGHLLNEKEWLLKEIHHRVKNNLHIITSLLESQSAYVKNDALAAIRDSQHRVYAMALIHQKLYNVEDMQTITCAEYLEELVNYLKDSFDVKNIEFIVNVTPVRLDVSQAVPIGLIVNEAVTNAVKYAFPDNRKGRISIRLELQATDNIILTVSDDGVGLPPDFNIEQVNSLGLKLIKGLSEDLDGALLMDTTKGTCIKISFKMLRLSYETQFTGSTQTGVI